MSLLNNKRGQVTIFIIIGILIVVIAGVLLYVNRDNVIDTRITGAQVEPVRTYIEDCIEEKLESDMAVIRENAGYVGDSPFVVPIGNPVNPRLIPALMVGGENKLPLLGNIEDQIASNIKDHLRNNCDLNPFRGSYIINEDLSSLNSFVSINDNEVLVTVKYPIIIGKGDQELLLDTFFVALPDDFGLIYEVIRIIVNENMPNGDGFVIDDDIDILSGRYDEIVPDYFDYDEESNGNYAVYIGTESESEKGIRRVEFGLET
jgi:hypothetical protein